MASKIKYFLAKLSAYQRPLQAAAVGLGYIGKSLPAFLSLMFSVKIW